MPINLNPNAPTSPTGVPITLSDARLAVQFWLRSNGFDTSLYPAYAIDQALGTCGDELVRRARLLQRSDTLTLTAGTNTLTGLPANFRPDRLMKSGAYLVGSNVQVTAYLPADYSPYYTQGAPVLPPTIGLRATLNLKQFELVLNESYAFRDSTTGNTLTGQPRDLAFQKRDGTGLVFPTPDQNYTLTLDWNDLFTVWLVGTQGAWSSTVSYSVGDAVSNGGNIYRATAPSLNVSPPGAGWVLVAAGTAPDPSTITFNLVDDYLRPLLLFGAPSRLQFNEPGNAYAAGAKSDWEKFIQQMEGEGDLGEMSIQREPACRISDEGPGGMLGFWP